MLLRRLVPAVSCPLCSSVLVSSVSCSDYRATPGRVTGLCNAFSPFTCCRWPWSWWMVGREMRQRASHTRLSGLPFIPIHHEEHGLCQAPWSHCQWGQATSFACRPANILNDMFHARSLPPIMLHAKLIQPAKPDPNQYSNAPCKAHSRYGGNPGWLAARLTVWSSITACYKCTRREVLT